MDFEIKKLVAASLQKWGSFSFEERIESIEKVKNTLANIEKPYYLKYTKAAEVFLRITKSFYESKDLF